MGANFAQQQQIAYAIWSTMSIEGSIELAYMTPDARRIAALMVRNRLAHVRRGRLVQASVAEEIDRWAAIG